MKLAALFSGGKDSTYSIFLAQKQGHEIAVLVTLKPENKASYMYHSLNIDFTEQQAEAMGLPIVTAKTMGEKEKELEELKQVLSNLKASKGIEGVVAGAVASNYQKERVEKICSELSLELVAPLWHKEPEALLREMIASGFKIVIVGIYAHGLGEEWLGKEITLENLGELVSLGEKFGFSVVGEGGEIETFVADCPLFKRRIEIVDSEKFFEKETGELKIKKIELVEKN